MLTLLRTELLKLTTTRWPWILVTVTLAATALQALQPVYKRAETGTPPSARPAPSWRCSTRWAAAPWSRCCWVC